MSFDVKQIGFQFEMFTLEQFEYVSIRINTSTLYVSQIKLTKMMIKLTNINK